MHIDNAFSSNGENFSWRGLLITLYVHNVSAQNIKFQNGEKHFSRFSNFMKYNKIDVDVFPCRIPPEFTIFMHMHNHFFAALSTAPDSQYTNYNGGGLRALKLSVLQINFFSRSSRREALKQLAIL